MNFPAIANIFRVARNPSLCIPHHVASTFDQLPIPLAKAIAAGRAKVKIRAVVLDKDNCFARPKTNHVHDDPSGNYRATLNLLKQTYTPSSLLIVSNSSGLHRKDPDGAKAREIEQDTGIAVLRHSEPKPAVSCAEAVLKHLARTADDPSQIAVVGDRIFTDVVMANAMGAQSIWIKSGVVPDRGLVTRLEYWVVGWLRGRGYEAPQ